MKKLFVETTEFTGRIGEILADEEYAAFRRRLSEHPDAGRVMSGCGGLRKIRLADPRRRKGKRGGVRIIYLHVPKANWIFLLDVYDKDEKEDLTAQEKKALRRLAETLEVEADRAVARAERTKDK